VAGGEDADYDVSEGHWGDSFADAHLSHWWVWKGKLDDGGWGFPVRCNAIGSAVQKLKLIDVHFFLQTRTASRRQQ